MNDGYHFFIRREGWGMIEYDFYCGLRYLRSGTCRREDWHQTRQDEVARGWGD